MFKKYHQRWRYQCAINCFNTVYTIYTVYTVYTIQTALHCIKSNMFAVYIVREGQNVIGLGRSASEQKSGVGEWMDTP